MNTRDQEFAGRIFEQVSQISNLSKTDQRKYGSTAHKLPILIRTAGAVQALTFIESRGNQNNQGKDPYFKLLDHLAKTVGFNDRAAMLDKSRTAPLSEYMRLSQQMMAALLWYKRFAQIVLGVNPEDDPEGSSEAQEEAIRVTESS